MIININGTCYELLKEYEVYNSPPVSITVLTYEDMINYKYMYVGLSCYVVENNKNYIFNDNFEWVENPQYYRIDLMNSWELSSDIPNPDPLYYDGVYQSFRNKGVDNSYDVLKITLFGYSTFKIYIRSFAEGGYDYTIASTLDATTYPTTWVDPTTKAHTRNMSNGGNNIEDYLEVVYDNISEGEHFIYVVYRKDVSGAVNDDRGYLLIGRAN